MLACQGESDDPFFPAKRASFRPGPVCVSVHFTSTVGHISLALIHFHFEAAEGMSVMCAVYSDPGTQGDLTLALIHSILRLWAIGAFTMGSSRAARRMAQSRPQTAVLEGAAEDHQLCGSMKTLGGTPAYIDAHPNYCSWYRYT